MRAERFSLFFPPYLRASGAARPSTAIGAIPLGGFVKITGMNPEEELPPDVAPRAYYHQPVWKRIVVIGAGPAVNLLIAFLLLFGLAFGAAESGPRVSDIATTPPRRGRCSPGDRILSVDGGAGRPGGARAQISSHQCPGEPRPGCRAATPAVLRIERDGRVVTLRVRPRYNPRQAARVIGFSFGRRPLNPSIPEAARLSVDLMWTVTTGTVEAIARIFDPGAARRDLGSRGQLRGDPPGLRVRHPPRAHDPGADQPLAGVINLFPFLPLDGGHIFWSLVEKVRGRPVPFRVMEQSGVIGFMLVIFLFIVRLSNDIGRLTGGRVRHPLGGARYFRLSS